MIKKDYELIAEALRTAANGHNASNLERRYYAFAFADLLQDTYPNFDRDKFIEATGAFANAPLPHRR